VAEYSHPGHCNVGKYTQPRGIVMSENIKYNGGSGAVLDQFWPFLIKYIGIKSNAISCYVGTINKYMYL
jgi:hypothetical protein